MPDILPAGFSRSRNLTDMRVVRITSYEQLAAIAQPWRELCQGRPFAGPDWLLPWMRRLGGQTELYSLAVYDGETLVAVAPWMRESSPILGRKVRFLGEGKASSDYLGVPHLEDSCREAAAAIAEWLIDAGGPDGWDVLHLDGCDDNDVCLNAVAEALTNAGGVREEAPELNAWRVELPATWEAYVASLSSHARRKARLAMRSDHETRLVVASPERREAQLATLVELHSARRQSLGDAGCFETPGFVEFLRDVASSSPEGTVELLRLDVDGVAVATAFTLISRESTPVQYLYQCGIDPARLSLQPGWRLNSLMIQRAIERGFGAVDYLRGDEEYKRRLGCRARPLGRIRVSSPRRTSRIRERIWSTLAAAKHWVAPPTSA